MTEQFRNVSTQRGGERLKVIKTGKRLSPTQTKVLKKFLDYPYKPISRKQIVLEIWGRHDHLTSRSFDVHLAQLRKEIEPAGLVIARHSLGRLMLTEMTYENDTALGKAVPKKRTI